MLSKQVDDKKLFLSRELAALDQKQLRRRLRPVSGAQDRRIVLDGKDVLNFCSNNYLGLANDPRLRQAAMDGMQAEGFGSGASRLVCGNMGAYQCLEQELARIKKTESALVFSTGYMANVGIISSLFGRDDIIFADRLNHASIVDGIILSQAKFKRYPHRDMEGLEQMLKESSGYKKKAIITDTVFSMDGDIAPLERIVELAEQYECLVMVDEAHALGVLGKNGVGAVEHFGLEGRIDIQMGTLSKAAGSFGAYVCGSQALVDLLVNKARSFIYTTGMPPAVAAASLKGVEIIVREPQRRAQLWANTNHVLAGLRRLGFDTLNTQTPIIPVMVRDARLAVRFSEKLFEQGIFVSAIRPPTVPLNTARLRLTVMATHTREDLDFLLENMARTGKDLCII